jgi:ferritin-like metal-binding protein YciE
MSSANLRELLVEEIKDIYYAEKQLTKALPKMAKAAQNPDLKAGFTQHLAETNGHVERLEKVFSLLDKPAKGKTCHAMVGLIKEGAEAIEDNDASPVRDAQLIGAAQRVEHYEMAAYGTAVAFAKQVGEKEVAALLQQTLDEEGATNKKLTALSKQVNADADAYEGDGDS